MAVLDGEATNQLKPDKTLAFEPRGEKPEFPEKRPLREENQQIQPTFDAEHQRNLAQSTLLEGKYPFCLFCFVFVFSSLTIASKVKTRGTIVTYTLQSKRSVGYTS